MKKILKRAFSFFLVAVMVLGVAPLSGFVGIELPELNLSSTKASAEETPTSGTCGENLTWTFDETTGELVISGAGNMMNYSFTSHAPWYDIRSGIKEVTVEKNVTSIGAHAFHYCGSLINITIPNSVTSIGDYAFQDCVNLTSTIFPDSITSIGGYAFGFCDSLTSVSISDSVTIIGEYAFYGCDNLTSINVEKNNKYYSSDEYGVLFNKGETQLIQYPVGNEKTSYTIPNSVTSIRDNAFYDCDSLTSITIPDNVTSIGDRAFYHCDSLTSISIPDSVISIGDNAFNSCDSLTSITIGDSVTSVGYNAFENCRKLTSITVDTANTAYSSDEYGVLFNKNKTKLIKHPDRRLRTSYTIPDGVTSIGEYAFYDCDNLVSITIPDGVTSIEIDAFYSCDRLADVYFAGTEAQWNVISIGSYNESLTNATIHFDSGNDDKHTITWIVDGEVFDIQKYTEGEVVYGTVDPTKAGYTFIGWVDENGDIPPTTMPSQDLTFTAMWESIDQDLYTIYLYVNGLFYYGISYLAGEEVAPIPDPTEEGCTFSGWINKDGYYEGFPTIMPDQDLYYYGIFNVNTYNAVFDATGGQWTDGSTTKSLEIEYGSPIITPDETPSREGYIFCGWADKYGSGEIISDFGNMEFDAEYEAVWYKEETNETSYTVETYIMDTQGEYDAPVSTNTYFKETDSVVQIEPEIKTGFTVSSDSVLSETINSDGSTTLKVYYSRNIYSVKFYDGENLLSNSNYYYDSIIAEPVPPVKQGYKLAGWSKDGKTVLSDLGNVPASDIVFYTVFEEAKFNVTFDANGGDGAPEDLINQSEGTLTLPSAKPSKPGSIFVGWSTDPMSSKPEYQAGDKVELTEDIKFYAVYTEVTEFNGNHYAVFDLNMTWDEAKAYCESLGGHLMTVTTQSEQDFAETLISERKMNCYWLGGYEESEANWKWVTGETFRYMNWGPGEPNNEGSGEDCIEIYAKHDTDNAPGHWNDMAKEGGNGFYKLSSTGFICEWELEKTTFNGHEYSVIDKSMTWHEAKAYCESLGGHLITITSKEEDDFAFGIINESFVGDCWFGATDEKVEGTWEWVTGEKFEYTNWYSGQPDNDFNGAEDYLVSYYGSSWNDIRNDDLRAEKWFICEWDIENSNAEYIAKWIVDGHMIQVLTVPEGTAITSPETPVKEGYEFLGWTPEVPETMPAQHMTFVAVWEKVDSSEDPDVPPETYEYETVVGVLEKYETSVILNETARWISKVCIDGHWYNLYEDNAYQERIKGYKDKQVVALIYNDYVSSIELLSELETDPKIFNFDSSIPTLEYYDGVFRKYDGSREDKWQTVSGTIVNPFADRSIDVSKIPALESLKFKNVSLTIKSSDKGIVSLDNGFFDIESDSMTIEIGDIGAGESINISERILDLKTKWKFPKDKKEHSVTLYYTVTGTLNGKTITRETSETIKLINKDYIDPGTESISRKLTIDEFCKELEDSINVCDILSDTEVISMKITLTLIKGFWQKKADVMTTEEVVSHLSDFIDTGVNSIDEFCELVIDNISDKIGKEEEKLEKELWDAIGSTVDKEAWSNFFEWYHGQQGLYKNSSKRTDVRCPVDVYVFDENGKTVLSIVENVITQLNEDIHAFVCEDDKIIYLPTDADYDIKIIATGNGTMDYIVTEYSSENELRKTIYEDISLIVDEYYAGVVTKSTMPDVDSYNLTSSDGTEFTYDDIKYINPNIDVQVEIFAPSTTNINYGDSIWLHADVTEVLPEGWYIEWTASNGNFDMEVSSDAKACKISPKKNGNTTFTATIYDAQGNAVSKDEQTMTSKAGFFDKIIAFFKKLFGLTKVIAQSLNTVY